MLITACMVSGMHHQAEYIADTCIVCCPGVFSAWQHHRRRVSMSRGSSQSHTAGSTLPVEGESTREIVSHAGSMFSMSINLCMFFMMSMDQTMVDG